MLARGKIIAFVGTRDRERAKAFYRDTLGLTLASDEPYAVVFDAGGTMLRVTPVNEVAAANYTVLGWEVDDVAAMVASLSGRGVRFERYDFMKQDEAGVWTAPGGAKVAWFRDPDGNLLSVSEFPDD
jgi:catechol 2,3-dioxygenase-like lactoylglutathione lyase family enzyme